MHRYCTEEKPVKILHYSDSCRFISRAAELKAGLARLATNSEHIMLSGHHCSLTDENNQLVGLCLMAGAHGCKCSAHSQERVLMQCSGSEPYQIREVHVDVP